MTNENKQDVERDEPRSYDAQMLKSGLDKTLQLIKSSFDKKYDKASIYWKGTKFTIGFQKGSPLVYACDVGRCPAYARKLGDSLYLELFGVEPVGMPNFDGISIGYERRFPFLRKRVFIDLNKGICPFDYNEKSYRFDSKGFCEFLGRLKREGLNGTRESLDGILEGLDEKEMKQIIPKAVRQKELRDEMNIYTKIVTSEAANYEKMGWDGSNLLKSVLSVYPTMRRELAWEDLDPCQDDQEIAYVFERFSLKEKFEEAIKTDSQTEKIAEGGK